MREFGLIFAHNAKISIKKERKKNNILVTIKWNNIFQLTFFLFMRVMWWCTLCNLALVIVITNLRIKKSCACYVIQFLQGDEELPKRQGGGKDHKKDYTFIAICCDLLKSSLLFIRKLATEKTADSKKKPLNV